jgi:hypothetical protein
VDLLMQLNVLMHTAVNALPVYMISGGVLL